MSSRKARVSACALATCALFAGISAPPASAQSPGGRAIRLRVFHLVDHSRTIRLPGGKRVPRPVETFVRYPAVGGPYPLIVFGHGFALSPATYAALLNAWASAGYVVAAPRFPLGSANAPGGPTETDLVNQPRDMSFVITRMLALGRRATGALAGKIDPARVAVAGHSDGAVTALAVAYDRTYRDPRVRAAVILSGASLPGLGPFARTGPPLLATQGTADPINPPSATTTLFRQAGRPKYLLWLLGASHLPPYTHERPQLGIVERATTAFLDHYLKRGPLRIFEAAASRRGLTRLVADP